MAMYAVPRLFGVVWMVFLGNFAMPLGVPPAAEDPVMARVAPKECVFYMTWSGVASPDAKSPNQTEQLLAEKEIQQSLKLIEEQIVAAIRAQSANDQQATAMVDDVHAVAKAVLTSPTAIFITKVETPKNGPPDIRGGAMVNLGEQAAEIGKALARLQDLALGKDSPKADESSPWRRLPLGPQDPEAQQGGSLRWAVKGRYLVIGLGEGEAEKIVERARQEPPEWLTQAKKQLAVPRPASLVYMNAAELLKLVGAHERELPRMLDALGLSGIKSLTCATGLDDSGCVSRAQLAVDGDLKGVLSLFAAEPLTKQQLAAIPKDASAAIALRLDPAKAYKELLEIAGRFDPRAREELSGGIEGFGKQWKLNVAEDILQSLGDTWRVYVSPSEGNLLFTGMTAVVDVRDHDRLVAANGKLVMGSLLGGMTGGLTSGLAQPNRSRPGTQIRQLKDGERTIFYATRYGDFSPFTPAWCITEKELVVALYPQQVKAYLERSDKAGGPSLADVPSAAGPIEANRPMAFGYLDTSAAMKLAYPIAQILLGFASNQTRHGGPEFDISLLPPMPPIARHLQPTVSTVSRTKEGIMVETRQTLPLGSGGLSIAPALWFLAAAPPSRGPMISTQQSLSMNNMKQIGQVLNSYEVSVGSFPAAAKGRGPGQPPVSWRVIILPYLDQQLLFQQYRLDEPWDSENNKKLISRMPSVFKTPGSRKAAQGMTNYLAVVGERYAMRADAGLRHQDFMDGLSRTIMLVEVNEERAVPWTKPEDFTPDQGTPTAGLIGLRGDNFLVVAADASVHVLPAHINPTTLNALFTRSGNEAVSFPPSGPTDAAPRTTPRRDAGVAKRAEPRVEKMDRPRPAESAPPRPANPPPAEPRFEMDRK